MIRFEEENPQQQKFLTGVFIKTGHITAATLRYAEPVFQSWDPSDVILDMEIDAGGKFSKRLSLWGDYVKAPTPGQDEAIQISSLGSAFKVTNLFKSMKIGGIDELTGKIVDLQNPDRKIEEDLIGEDICFVEYAAENKDKKLTYHTFDRAVIVFTGREKEAKKMLMTQFISQVDKGYVRDYNPELYETHRANLASDGEKKDLKSFGDLASENTEQDTKPDNQLAFGGETGKDKDPPF